MSLVRAESCTEIGDASKGRINNTESDIRMPFREGGTVSSLAVVLQHYLISLVWSAGQGWGYRTGANGNGQFAGGFTTPIDPPEYEGYVPSKLPLAEAAATSCRSRRATPPLSLGSIRREGMSWQQVLRT